MHGSRSLQALLPLLLLLLEAARALREEEQHAIVDLHNLYRAQVAPPAADMLQMRWDKELAAFAKAYAQKCVWGHNKERGRRGENLFAITDEGVDVPLAMEEWHQEREHYNLSTATCEPGQMCGHYTQVVWSKTEKIGCGTHFCEKLQGVEETNIQLLVCNYEPPGNVKGKRPYQEGTPCSQCPSGYRCENSLCEPTRGPEDVPDLPQLVSEAPSTLATEAAGSKRADTRSLATELPRFAVTEVLGAQATKTPPAVERKASSSLSTKGPSPVATEAPPSLPTEALSTWTTHNLLSLHEGPASYPKPTHVPFPKSAGKAASKTSTPSVSPQRSLYPKMFPTGKGEPLPHIQEEAEAEAKLPPANEIEAKLSPSSEAEAELPPSSEVEAKLPPSSEAEAKLLPPSEAEIELPPSSKVEAKLPPSGEVLDSVFPAEDKPGELQATLDHMGLTSSKSLSSFPNASASANATGGRTLALQSSFPGAEGPEKPGGESWPNSGPTWGPLLGIQLLPPLLLAGIF